MTEPAIPPKAQARDRTDLGFAAVIALGVAAVLLVLVVLPAEYGIDPTGFGRVTGISALSGDGSDVHVGDRLATVNKAEPAAPRNDTVTLTLAGLGDDLEYKFHLDANQTMLYSWRADGIVEFDFHGDPDDPSRPGEFSSYEAGQGLDRSGSFQAPFDGRHGWYFRNIGNGPVTITLQTWGYYDLVGRL